MAYDSLPHKTIWEHFFRGGRPGVDFRALVHCKYGEECQKDLAKHPLFNLIATVETEYCFGLVAAMNKLLQNALEASPGHRNDKFIFVSDTTLPVKPFHYVQQNLAMDDTSHFCFFPVHWLPWPESSSFFSFVLSWLPFTHAGKERMALKHHQWMVLSRQHALNAIKKDGAFPSLLSDLRVNYPGATSGCSDEFWHFNILYHGVNVSDLNLASLVHLDGIAKGDLHYDARELQGQCDTFVYWQSEVNDGSTGPAKDLGKLLEDDAFTQLSHKVAHPCEITSLGNRSIRALRQSPFLFARKIMPGSTWRESATLPQSTNLVAAFDTMVFKDAVEM